MAILGLPGGYSSTRETHLFPLKGRLWMWERVAASTCPAGWLRALLPQLAPELPHAELAPRHWSGPNSELPILLMTNTLPVLLFLN